MTQTTKPKRRTRLGIALAILAAALYAFNAPFSKLLLDRADPSMMAAFLYLGTGLGMALLLPVQKRLEPTGEEKPLAKNDLPYTVGMILLDILAPILLMFGLQRTTAANAALLNNFEIVATSLIALFIFRERISKKLWLAIGLISLASFILSFEDPRSLSFSFGSLLVLAASVSWGFENNCTRQLSDKNPLHITMLKGFGSGAGALIVALLMREQFPAFRVTLLILLLGFVAYGLSIMVYIYAQRYLGAAKTSAFYAISPFIGAGLSLALFRELPPWFFVIALVIMGVGTYLAASEHRSD